MKVKKSYDEINERIRKGEVVVLTAEEVTRMADELTFDEIAKKVDVVTTATFGPMCSSGVFINFGHSNPPIKIRSATLNGVPVHAGLASVDSYLGATELSRDNDEYGGAHVIETLIAGGDIKLEAKGVGTDCYPRKEINTYVNKEDLNEVYLYNPRNVYQNYPAATNSSPEVKYTYMGILLPKYANVTYSTSGELSPLLNDPDLRTIGIGTNIFLCGAVGHVAWRGTQFDNRKRKNAKGIPVTNSSSLSLIGDLKEMDKRYLRAAVYEGYGVSIFIGAGIPIPILDEDMAKRVSIRNADIETTIFDYGRQERPALGTTNYRVLRSGRINLNGKETRTAPMSSLMKAREIAGILKQWIMNGDFYLNEPVTYFDGDYSSKPLRLKERSGKGLSQIDIDEITVDPDNRILLRIGDCIHCGACVAVCKPETLRIDSTSGGLIVAGNNCTACGLCIKACPLRLFKYAG